MLRLTKETTARIRRKLGSLVMRKVDLEFSYFSPMCRPSSRRHVIPSETTGQMMHCCNSLWSEAGRGFGSHRRTVLEIGKPQ